MRLRVLWRRSPAATVAYFAACLSVLLSASALVPWDAVRGLALVTGAGVALAFAPTYLRRAAPASAVALTVGAAVVSTAITIGLAGTAQILIEGRSCSQAGGNGGPADWLFSTTSWFLGVGLLASGYLVARAGLRARHLGKRSCRSATALAIVPFIGFGIVGACAVGRDHTFYVVHNLAAVAAMGAFWLGMVWSLLSRGLPRRLRIYSGVSAGVVLAAWLPTALRFLNIAKTSPIETLPMELLVFLLSFTWLWWLAIEWEREAARN